MKQRPPSPVLIACIFFLNPLGWVDAQQQVAGSEEPTSQQRTETPEGESAPPAEAPLALDQADRPVTAETERTVTGGQHLLLGSWVLTAVLAAASTALAMKLFQHRKEERHFAQLREQLIASTGDRALFLLPEEALRLLVEVRGGVEQWVDHFLQGVRDERAASAELMSEVKSTALDSKRQIDDVVEAFKSQINDHLEKAGHAMRQIAAASAKAHQASNETLDYSKQVAETLIAKEAEIKLLKEGYQKALLGPLLKEMVTVRDDLIDLACTVSDPVTKAHLEHLDEKLSKALGELGISEITIPSDPNQAPLHHWDALPAAEVTRERDLHGKTAGVAKRGYLVTRSDGDPLVLRKSTVVRYRFEPSESDHDPSGTDEPAAPDQRAIAPDPGTQSPHPQQA